MFGIKFLPRPAGTPAPNLWDKFVRLLPDWLVNSTENIIQFVDENILWFLAFLIVILIVKFIIDHFRRHEKQIEKLWIFTLFFLSKRQMMIPLIVTLAKKDNVLPPKTLTELLSIREKVRNVSLRKSPRKRLKLEQQVSKILFEYFSLLDKKGQIQSGSKLERVIRDLEFIDKKLVELQKIYNHESQKWNQKFTNPFTSIFFKLFRFPKFEPFATEK